MKKIKSVAAAVLALCILLASGVFAFPAFTNTAEAASPGVWIGSWSTAAVDGSISLEQYVPGFKVNDFIPAHSVVRTELQLSAGGLYTKFCFSNEYGTADLKIGAASVAKTDTDNRAAIHTDTATAITFNDGQTSAVIKPGETLWTDSIYFPTDSLEYVTVSVYFPATTYIKTGGLYGGRSFLNIGANESAINSRATNANNEIRISSGAITYHTIPFLTRVDVRSTYADAYSVVFIGDSTLTNEAYHYYAQRAYADGHTHIGFVNNSIVANRLLHDGTGLIGNLYGKAVIDRFERDALDITGAKVILVKIGLNDILHPMTESMKGVAPYSSVEDIIAGYEQIIKAARSKGMKIYFFTKSAWKGYEREFLGQTGDLSWTKDAQEMCDQLDAWVKSTKLIDGYFDMSPLSSPVDSNALLPAFTTDGAHLTELGAVAMADLIPGRIIGTGSLPLAADINGVNPYASVQSVIDAHNASQTTTQNNASNSGNTNNGNGGITPSMSEDESIAASVLASRQEAANQAGNAGKPPVTTTKNNTQTTTTKKNNSNNITETTTKKAETTTAATTVANTTAPTGSAATNATVPTTPADTTANAANTTATAAGATSANTVITTDNVAEPVATQPFSVSVEIGGSAQADEMGAAQKPVVAEKFTSNGSMIGIVMVVIMVALIAAAVIITMKSKRRGDY